MLAQAHGEAVLEIMISVADGYHENELSKRLPGMHRASCVNSSYPAQLGSSFA